ncbi:pseudouridine synthase [Chitiniphilus shinanonensis]|uniref:Dual-specificity RNA pseudouridine synthase RluA n=1 Tax=Chitiniphilus shinanonensis TaxID=553088 RepID=A0ABQ6BTB1_9NEIS|nr:pseudouridine synthase [Chitiniphilus shinanonensis]GLS05250.1 pseudouridine synthase [Chitiniphilus shinanonensis]
MFQYLPPPDLGLIPVFVDDCLLVVDKPHGLLSVPGRGAAHADSMTSRVQARYPDALIVHRLDMDTSGLMVFGRGAAMQRALSMAFEARRVDKRYVALVDGCLDGEGEVALPLIADWPNRPRQKVDVELGKPSLTRYCALDYDAALDATRVALVPVTGRSHQLRVHLQAIGHPILGDPFYATPAALAKAPRLLLHADTLALSHPAGGRALHWHCPAPF